MNGSSKMTASTKALVIAGVILVAVAAIAVPVAAFGDSTITELTAPGEAEAGDTVTVIAEGVSDTSGDQTLHVEVYWYTPAGDGETICTDSADLQQFGETEVDCTGSFVMPQHDDVSVVARLYLSGTGTEDLQETSIALEEGDDGLLDALTDLPGAIVDRLFAVFDTAAEKMVGLLTHLFVSHPEIHPNDDVQEIHRLAMISAMLLAAPMIMIFSILLMLGYSEVYNQPITRWIGRLVLVLALGAVAPPLIQYGVDFSEAMTIAFKPEDPGLLETTLLTAELAVVGFLNAFLLLAVAVTFIVRDLYFLFFAAAAPIIFLFQVTPYLNRFSRVFIGTFVGFVLIGMFEMIAFNLTLSLLEMDGYESPSWLLAFGGIVLMTALPFMIIPAAWMMVGPAALLTRTAAGKAAGVAGKAWNQRRDDGSGGRGESDYRPYSDGSSSTGSAGSGGNRYDKSVILDHHGSDDEGGGGR